LTLTRQNAPALAVVVLSGLYLVITSAFFPLDFLTVFDGKRILQLTLFTVILIFAVAWAPLRTATITQLNRLSTLSRVCLVTFFSIGIVSSLRLEHPAYALIDVSMIFILLVLVAVMAASRDLASERFDKLAVLLLAAMGFAVAVQELMGFAASWMLGVEFSYEQAFMYFAHPRFYNQLQTWSIPVIAALPIIFPRKTWLKAACVLLLGLQWFLVIAVAARGTFVSLISAMIFIALWLPGQRKYWLKFQAGGLLLGIGIYYVVLLLNQAIIPQSQSGGGEFYEHSVGRPMAHTSGRTIFWRLSIEDARQHPILGAGPTRYACGSEIFRLPAHPHSFIFRILGEWGIIALALLLVIAVTWGAGFLKILRKIDNPGSTDPPLDSMVATSLLAGIIHACLSGLFIMPASQVATIMIGGWSLSLTGRKGLAQGKAVWEVPAVLTAMFLALIILISATADISKAAKQDTVSEQRHPAVPRFWQDGRACNDNHTNSAAQG